MSFLHPEPVAVHEYPTFQTIQDAFGFVPNFYRAQTSRKDLIDAETVFVGNILMHDGALSRRQKEYVFLTISARNLSTYCVTAHCEIIRMLKIEGPEPEQIAIDHTVTSLSLRDKALLNFVIKLNARPRELEQGDVDTLRTFGFTDAHILEAIVVTGLAQFANTVSFGLGTVPDFENERVNFAARG